MQDFPMLDCLINFFPSNSILWPARRRAAAKKMKGLSKDSSKEEEELDDMEMTDPFSDLQVCYLLISLYSM